MRYWWVNQNQTHRQELAGGYLWSPKRNANGARNPFYESMREVAPGDLVVSFVDTRIVCIGVAQSYCWELPKPVEFGNAGQNWENVGWKVKVHFTSLHNQVRPKDHIEILRNLLPERYSPLQPNGNGLQSVYLAKSLYRSGERISLSSARSMVKGAINALPENSFPNCSVGLAPLTILREAAVLGRGGSAYHKLRNLERAYLALQAVSSTLVEHPGLKHLRRWLENPRAYAALAGRLEASLLFEMQKAVSEARLRTR